MDSTAPDTHIVLLAVGAFGHVRPVLALASSLTALGYPVTVATGTGFRAKVEAIKGVEFVALQGKADLDFGRPFAELFPDRPKEYSFLFDFQRSLVDPLVDQAKTVRELLDRSDLRDRKVVIVQDGTFMGTMPMMLGSRQFRRVPVIGIGHFPLGISSKDTAPFNSGMHSQGEELNTKMNEGAIAMFQPIMEAQQRLLEPSECTKPLSCRYFFDNWVALADIWCQLCVPALEPHRSDLPENVRFCGTLTGYNGNIGSKTPHPGWFEDFVLADQTGRPLVLVTSGSLPDLDPHHLILPTIEACKDLNVRVVVCAVRVELPRGQELPQNVRWAEWIPFEDIFSHTSVVVSNGGYGGVSQAFANGIPMILAGETEDKKHCGMLGEATGAAINLKTQTPSVKQLRNAVSEIQSNSSYKQKALELKKSYAEYDPVQSFVDAIEEVSSQVFHT